MKRLAFFSMIAFLFVLFASPAVAQRMHHGGADDNDDRPRQGMGMQDGGQGMMGGGQGMMGGGQGMMGGGQGMMCPMCPMGGQMMGRGMGMGGGGMGMMGPMHGGMHGMGMGMMKGGKGPSFYLDQKSKLNLTDEQIPQLREIRRDFRKDFIRQSAEVKIAMIDLNETFQGDWNVEEAEKQLREISQARTDLLVRYLQARKSAEEVLTPEQLQQVRDESGMDGSGEDLFED